MYTPRHFKMKDRSEIQRFIEAHSFGTVVTTENGKPIATHIPLQLLKREDEYVLTGHVAYANPQWKTFENSGDNVLVMFQGPHAYVSSSWYEDEEVPTWNYQSVHIYGRAEIMTEDELEADLIQLMEKYEQGRENPVVWSELSEQTKKQMRGIVGFTITIKDVQATNKLSQNRSENDHKSIIDALSNETDTQAHAVANVMKTRTSN